MTDRPIWDARCSAILRRMAGSNHDHTVSLQIEFETGMRFEPRTVAEHRRDAGLPPCRTNNWTAPLRLWRARAA